MDTEKVLLRGLLRLTYCSIFIQKFLKRKNVNTFYINISSLQPVFCKMVKWVCCHMETLCNYGSDLCETSGV